MGNDLSSRDRVYLSLTEVLEHYRVSKGLKLKQLGLVPEKDTIIVGEKSKIPSSERIFSATLDTFEKETGYRKVIIVSSPYDSNSVKVLDSKFDELGKMIADHLSKAK